MTVYGIIMAGGQGTRFWPLSRQTTPKQLLNLSGNGLMINETIDRLSGIIDKKNIFIVTNAKQAEKMKSQVEEGIIKENILIEPEARNTSACIGYAATKIMRTYGDGIMCIFPADHYIKDVPSFENSLKAAINEAKATDNLVTLGIKPSFASTGYGYLKYEKNNKNEIYAVEEFVEKPDYETAKLYIETGNYAWNSGMFIWKISVILENFKRFLPKVYGYLEKIGDKVGTASEKETIEKVYPRIPSISIDYGIMERSDTVVMLEGDFGWSDVGSWDALAEIYSIDDFGNVVHGDQINIETKNCILYSENRLIATIGTENLIIVETEDAVLVCRKDKAQQVRQVVDELVKQGRNEYI